MDEPIKSLILSVKKTLEDFTAGRISTEECRQEYKRHSTEYDSLQNIMLHETDILTSLCYIHSTDNFALFTGIYRMDPGALTTLHTCGNDSFNLALQKMRNSLISQLSEHTIVSLPPGGDNPLPHTVNICIIPGESAVPQLFIAVSSSHYFSMDEFVNTAMTIGMLKKLAEYQIRPMYFPFFSERYSMVEGWIIKGLDQGSSVTAYYYLFNMVERIFSHLRLTEMLKISSIIKNSLTEKSAPPGAGVFELSMREYLILVPESTETTIERKKFIIEYQGNSIPFKMQEFTIRKKDDIIGFWDSILDFERRISSGERVR